VIRHIAFPTEQTTFRSKQNDCVGRAITFRELENNLLHLVNSFRAQQNELCPGHFAKNEIEYMMAVSVFSYSTYEIS
jgi:hypothetical protein